MLLFTLAENCPVAVFKFVKDDKDEHDRLVVIKCLLDLFHNALNVSYDTILKLEWTDLLPPEVYDMMNSLEGKLQWNIGSKLRGYKCSSSKNTSWQQHELCSVIQGLMSANMTIFTWYNHLHSGDTGFTKEFKLFKSWAETSCWEILCVSYAKNLVRRACTSQILNFVHGILLYIQIPGSLNFLYFVELIMSTSTSNAEGEQIISLDKRTWTDCSRPQNIDYAKFELQIKAQMKVNSSYSCKESYDFL